MPTNTLDRIAGLLFSGFACKVGGAAFAAWVAIDATRAFVAPVLAAAAALK